MKTRTTNESGSVLIAFALFLVILIAFMGLGMEAGRWFLVRAELSKTVDAAALVAAKNISNPFANNLTIGREFATENFPSGFLGTPGSGGGAATFNVRMIGIDKVQVDGQVSATAIMSHIFGFDLIPISSSGVAQKKDVEIMMILDRSGSMAGQAMTDLKDAAKGFISYFRTTQGEDKMGLVSFSTYVTIDVALGNNYVNRMNTAVDAMRAENWTNSSDALDQAFGPNALSDQTGLPGDQRVQQFVVFFSDGQPTAFRGDFGVQNTIYDAVVHSDGSCRGGDRPNGTLFYPDRDQAYVAPAASMPTGDGVYPTSACGAGTSTTRWYILDSNPVPGYGPTACTIPTNTLGTHLCNLADGLAVLKAQEIKNKRITIYSIGYGDVDASFMRQIATSDEFYYRAPSSGQIETIFKKVAQEIKLRLVQ